MRTAPMRRRAPPLAGIRQARRYCPGSAARPPAARPATPAGTLQVVGNLLFSTGPLLPATYAMDAADLARWAPQRRSDSPRRCCRAGRMRPSAPSRRAFASVACSRACFRDWQGLPFSPEDRKLERSRHLGIGRCRPGSCMHLCKEKRQAGASTCSGREGPARSGAPRAPRSAGTAAGPTATLPGT